MIKEKIKNKFHIIDVVLLIFILIASILCRENNFFLRLIQIFINIIMLVYYLYRIKKNQNIEFINTKLDIFVLLLVISTIVPLIFNTYVSLSTTVETILNYITLFWVYILIKQMCQKSDKRITWIKNISIIFSIILVILGIETLTTNKIFNFLGLNIARNGENRLISLISNPNSFASLMMFNFFISMNEMLNADSKKKKTFYVLCNTILFLGILLTYSKLTYIILTFIMIIYFITLKNKKQKILMIQNIIQLLLMTAIYIYVFEKLLLKQYYLSIFLFSFLWLEMSLIFNQLIIKYTEKIKLKTCIITTVVIVLIAVTCICIGLHVKKPYIVFDKNTIADYNAKILKNIKPNEKYVFSFNIEAETYADNLKEQEDMFTIKIIERDSKSLEEIKSTEFVFGNFTGTKDIEEITSPNTTEIKIEFKAKSKEIPKKMAINQFLLNGKEVILEYKYLPTKLVEKISDISINYKTAQERFVFIKDALKLISNNFFTGIGGKGWQFKYGEVQQYGYVSNDVHSYYIQIMLEFGYLVF